MSHHYGNQAAAERLDLRILHLVFRQRDAASRIHVLRQGTKENKLPDDTVLLLIRHNNNNNAALSTTCRGKGIAVCVTDLDLNEFCRELSGGAAVTRPLKRREYTR